MGGVRIYVYGDWPISFHVLGSQGCLFFSFLVIRFTEHTFTINSLPNKQFLEVNFVPLEFLVIGAEQEIDRIPGARHLEIANFW